MKYPGPFWIQTLIKEAYELNGVTIEVVGGPKGDPYTLKVSQNHQMFQKNKNKQITISKQTEKLFIFATIIYVQITQAFCVRKTKWVGMYCKEKIFKADFYLRYIGFY